MKPNEPKTKAAPVPRIYVASLADYNAGRVLARWIDADQSADDIYAEIHAMLKESKELVAEDWAIHDYENFGEVRISEFEDLDHIAEAAMLIVEHGSVFAALLAHVGDVSDVSKAQALMTENYRGCFESLADYVQEFVEDCYADILKPLPDFIRYHIDYEAIAHDMELNGEVFSVFVDGMHYVFDGDW